MNHPHTVPDIHAGQLAAITGQLQQVLLDKPQAVRLALACIVARGHLLLEDLPGMGKTLLAQALARTLGLDFKRVQFTSDLLPGDLLGASVFERDSGSFRFVAGPVFSEVLLADEINRASPKTQSALLQAMEERQVAVDGGNLSLPPVFFVLATQNPADQHGVHPLPEAQLDRFLMRLSLGYPSREAELALLAGGDRHTQAQHLPPLLDAAQLQHLQQRAAGLTTSPALLEYIHALLQASRECGLFCHGLSPRAGQSLLAAARAWALLDGRDFVVPSDVQTVLPYVAGHRLRSARGGDVAEALARLQAEVALP